MKRIAVVYGTRPEAIKMAPLVDGLNRHQDFEPIVIVTGQHREMLDQVNELFDIVPAHDLDLMRESKSITDLSSRALAALAKVFRKENPDAVVVQGDTTTAFVAALAAYYLQIPVFHLEAGLRTGNLMSPFPEEGNRQMISRVASLHLAPTQQARHNLEGEGVSPSRISVTGNTVIDALLVAATRPAEFDEPSVREIVTGQSQFVLVTTHRRESWGQSMRNAMSAIAEVAELYPEVRWLVPMHRNPVVRDVVMEELGGMRQIVLCEPLDYHQFCHAMKRSRFVLTDSGGVQEEAPSLGRPVLVMRDNTERPEALQAGTARLVGTERRSLIKWLTRLIADESCYQEMSEAINPYGDGHAIARCVAAAGSYFGLSPRLPDFTASGGHVGIPPTDL